MSHINHDNLNERFIAFLNNRDSLFAQITKFTFVGGLSFVIDAGILYLLSELFGVKFYLIFGAISFSISVVANYLLSMRFVFEGKKEIKKHKELMIFIVLSVIGLLINQLLMSILGNMVTYYTELNSGYVMLIKIIATFVVMVWNFISRKIFLEKKS